MFRFYLKGVGTFFIAVGLLTIFAPTGGLMVLLGIAMLIQAGLITLALRVSAKAAELTHRAVAAWRAETELETQTSGEWLPAPAPARNPARPLHV